jgi:hypothetical protein
MYVKSIHTTKQKEITVEAQRLLNTSDNEEFHLTE